MKGKMNAEGPGGKLARAKNKLDKAVTKLPASRDTPSERKEKMANIDKTNAKVAKRVDKLTKVVGKSADKAVKKVTKRIASDKASNMEVASYLKSKMK